MPDLKLKEYVPKKQDYASSESTLDSGAHTKALSPDVKLKSAPKFSQTKEQAKAAALRKQPPDTDEFSEETD